MAPLKQLTIVFSEQGAAIHETLLTGLQPHCRLLAISIEEYRGLKLPLWTESLTISLPHLVRIHLVNFNCLTILPSLSQLRHLKSLMLEGISNVEFVESDGVVVPSENQLTFFPSLEELRLHELPKLKGWWREETNKVTGDAGASSVVVPSFPCLRDLVLRRCPHLTAFPSCPKLISVELFDVHEALTLAGSKTLVPNNPTTGLVLHLKKLVIDNVGSLDCLFGESLGGIQWLSIECFEGESLSNVAEKHARHISSVEIMDLRNCSNLNSLSGVVNHLTSLQSLTIMDCKNLVLENNEQVVNVMLWKSLHLLSSLTLNGLPTLSNLPKGFQYLTSLESLNIYHCENLEALPEWLNCLTSLQNLSIHECYKVKSVPEAIAHMPSLKTLNLIRAGEELKKRCRKPDGEDWPKICHIPHISFKKIKMSVSYLKELKGEETEEGSEMNHG